MKRLSANILSKLGKKPITEITARIAACDPPDRSSRQTPYCPAHVANHQRFRYAVACGKVQRDITQDLRGALTPVQSKTI
ncbi:MAG: hypothetical protein R3D71_03660 [Rickettsiales bacterium]